jgi:hypothetical protein
MDRFRGSGHQSGGYVQDTVTFASGRGRFTAGVRQDQLSVSPVQTTTPYTSLSFRVHENTRILLEWGQYAHFPELAELFSSFAQGSLLPERSTHYEVAVEQRLDERTRLRVEFYNRQDRDLLARPAIEPRAIAGDSIVPASPFALWLNSQRGYARGVEVFLQRRTANGFTGWISYAYDRTGIRDGALGLNFPSDFDQRHTFNIYASRRLRPSVNLSGRFTYGSGMPVPGFYRVVPGGYAISANRNELRAPTYQRTDLRINKAYVHQKYTATVFGEIVNLTNHTNRDFDSAGPYDIVTSRTYPTFFTMFPILPSVGVMFEF